jgi:hypothetical protein
MTTRYMLLNFIFFKLLKNQLKCIITSAVFIDVSDTFNVYRYGDINTIFESRLQKSMK